MEIQNWRPVRELGKRLPWKEVEDLESMVAQNVGKPLMSMFNRSPIESNWIPAIDLYETDDGFSLRVELPGVEEKDIDISASDNSIMVKGRKRIHSGASEEHYRRSECMYGNFFRDILLPATINKEKTSASYHNGVVEISVLRSGRESARKIPVNKKRQPDHG